MSFFNFSRLITKYSREFTVMTKGKKVLNKAGDWVYSEPTEITLNGAVIGFTESKVQRSEGTLTTNDKALYTLKPIDEALMGATVVFNGNKYKIETQKSKSNAEFTGCYAYTLKWISAFNGEGEKDD